jgi:hypothetical protein
MNTRVNKILLIVSLLSHLTFSSRGQYYYVSTDGNDFNAGSKDNPLKSIQTAIEKSQGTNATIYVRDGVYSIEKPIVIRPENSGIKLLAYPHEKVIFTAGSEIDNWERVNHPMLGKAKSANVWKTYLPDYENILTLYDKNGLLPRCASPEFKTMERAVEMKEGADAPVESASQAVVTPTKMYFKEGQIDHVKDFSGAEIFILPRYDWVANYLPVKTVNRQERYLETVCPGTYELSTPPTWTQIELFYRLENVPEFLDEPGEWYFNIKTKTLYLITRNEEKPDGIIVPRLNQIIRIEGDIEANQLVDGATIEGITFRYTERMTWVNGRVGVQHDWGVVDGEWACIKMKGAKNVEISNCLFENLGGEGIRMDFVGWNNTIANNEFRNLGGAAISLIGYAPGTNDKLHSNKITNNHISQCAGLWWLQPGILVCQSSSNLIANNLIHDMPYNGIALVGGRSAFTNGRLSTFEGDGMSYVNWDEIPGEVVEWYERLGFISTRDNVLEHNEIFDVVKTLGDGNGIYLSGTGTGNILQKNYIHHISSLSSAGGMRFDNATWFCTMRNNIIWNVNGSGIVSKKVNNVENNIIANSGVRSVLLLADGPKWGSNIRRNIVANSWEIFEPTMNQWMVPEDILIKGELGECIITDNLFYVPDDVRLGERITEKVNMNLNASQNFHEDPLFYDMENGDFRLKEMSPALKTGFVPFYDYGLQSVPGRVKYLFY